MVFLEPWGQGHLMETGTLKELAKPPESEKEGKKHTGVSPPPTSQSDSRASHWLDPKGGQPTRKPGKCSPRAKTASKWLSLNLNTCLIESSESQLFSWKNTEATFMFLQGGTCSPIWKQEAQVTLPDSGQHAWQTQWGRQRHEHQSQLRQWLFV